MWPHDFGHSGLSVGDLHHYHSGSAAIVHLLRRRRGQGPRSTPRSARTVLVRRENGTYSSRERYLLLVRTDEVASRHRALAAPGAPSPAGASTWTRGPALHGLRRLDDVGPSLGHVRTGPPPTAWLPDRLAASGARANRPQTSPPWAQTQEPRRCTVCAVRSRHRGHGRDGRPSPPGLGGPATVSGHGREAAWTHEDRAALRRVTESRPVRSRQPARTEASSGPRPQQDRLSRSRVRHRARSHDE